MYRDLLYYIVIYILYYLYLGDCYASDYLSINGSLPDMLFNLYFFSVICRINIFLLLLCVFTADESLACQGFSANLTCPVTMEIRIDSAVYGHYNHSLCGGSLDATNCHQAGDFDVVDGRCSGQQTCSITADTDTFGGDPCFATTKYLLVHYTCVRGECAKITCRRSECETIRCRRSECEIINILLSQLWWKRHRLLIVSCVFKALYSDVFRVKIKTYNYVSTNIGL